MSVLHYAIPLLDGQPCDLAQYQGHVVLVVNTASRCGFTPQFDTLERLYQEFKDDGLVILGFPCNQFGEQEPGTPEQIGDVCRRHYGVTFPMFDKLDVNGLHAHPFFEELKDQAPGLLGSKSIKWNFTKFLIDRYGNVVERFAPSTDPSKLKDDIRRLLRG